MFKDNPFYSIRKRLWRETQQYQKPEQEILLIHEVTMMNISGCIITN
jgi:hypothetical protein